MDRLTKRLEDGQAVMDCAACGVSWHKKREKDIPYCTTLFCRNRLKERLAAYEDTGLEPEEIKDNMEMFRAYRHICAGHEPEHIRDLFQAEQDGRLVVLDEKTALSMCAGARAIENNKRLFGVTYGYDIFGVCGGPKEISYYDAAKKLREIAEPVLDREEAALDGKGSKNE